MATPVKVAVYIDRGDAIRAGRNKWGWQSTKIDLDTLDVSLREALSRCPENRGAILITHSATWPGREEPDNGFSSILLHDSFEDVRDAFDVEREDISPPIESTPATAVQILEHLASLPNRLREKGQALLASTEAGVNARRAQLAEKMNSFLADLDQWLTTAPEELFTEKEEDMFDSLHFERVEPPQPPSLAIVWDGHIAFDLEEARRLLEGKRPRNEAGKPERGQPSYEIFGRREFLVPEYLAQAEEALQQGRQQRAEAIKQHRQAIAAAEQRRLEAWQKAKWAEGEAERRIAAEEDRRATEAYRAAANNKALREWAAAGRKDEILKLIDDGAAAATITEAVRSVLFEPLAEFPTFKKIRKQDLLAANPNFAHNSSGLEAVFDDAEVSFTNPHHHATAQAIVLATFKANISGQFAGRLHRGRLTRRGQVVGVPVEARSLLLTAHFGDLKISRAFAIGIVAPVESDENSLSGLPAAILRDLRNHQIDDVETLCQFSRKSLIKEVVNIGPGRVDVIEEFLAAKGRSLRPDIQIVEAPFRPALN